MGMEAEITTIMFYVFALMTIASALSVITTNNPVYSVFYLILAFFNTAGLFVLLGAEYIAMTLVIVYVGAVAVLFLFVVMMLNINFEKMHAGFMRHLPFGLLIAFVLFVEISLLVYASFTHPMQTVAPAISIAALGKMTNTVAIGSVLYTRYALLFQLAGLILLVAMIGAIVLTLRQRTGVKRQKIHRQLSRTREDSIRLVQVKTGEGA